MGDLFAGLSIWIDGELPHAAQLARQIANQGGDITAELEEATHFVLHPETASFNTTYVWATRYEGIIVAPHWITDCCIWRRALDAEDDLYQIERQKSPSPAKVTRRSDPPRPKKRKVSEADQKDELEPSSSPPKKKASKKKGKRKYTRRTEFTEQDDEILARAVAKYGERLSKNALVKKLADKHPSHPWMGWKERWRKTKAEYIADRVEQIRKDEPDLAEEAFSSESETEHPKAERPATSERTPPKTRAATKANGSKKRKSSTPEESSSEIEESEEEEEQQPVKSSKSNGKKAKGTARKSVPRTASHRSAAEPAEDEANEYPEQMSASQAKNTFPQDFEDVMWAACGDTAVVEKFFAVDVEMQADMTDDGSLWTPEQDAAIVAAENFEALTAVAQDRGCAMEDVHRRQAYFADHQAQSRLPPGAMRWPFVSRDAER